MATINEKMTAIANGFRKSRGITGKINLDKMAELAETPLNENLPSLSSPGSSADLAAGKELIGPDGSVVTGTLKESAGSIAHNAGTPVYSEAEVAGSTVKSIGVKAVANEDIIVRSGSEFLAFASALDFGDATAADVASGKTFTSINGVKLVGTNTDGGTGGNVPSVEGVEF